MQDETLDEMRLRLIAELPRHANFDGWGEQALERAAAALGIHPKVAALAFPNPLDMIRAWFAYIDSEMCAAWPKDRCATLKIRERITQLVLARIGLLAPHREALRRALAILAQPQNLAVSAQLSWHSADTMWRQAGDTALDYNHYTKRMTLGGVYISTLMVFLQDESADLEETKAFLTRRIENVMQFEKAKAQFTAREMPFSLTRLLGKMRYPQAA
jgi:ubiquinone biosynthesis protein COQ9